jgi:Zn-dependent M16 (insulinase) family peptidase
VQIALVGEPQPVRDGAGLLDQSNGLSELAAPTSAADRFSAPDVSVDAAVPREGWATSSSVSFVASVFETVRMMHEDAPALAAAAKLLRSMYLHREIREKGGAYGGFAVYNAETGLFCFASYRDPHIVATLNAFDAASDFIQSGAFGEEDVKEAVLQVCSEIDKPDTPGPAARKAFYRKILSVTDENRERFKRQLLKLDRDRMVAVGEKYFGPEKARGVAVISGEPQLDAANEKLGANAMALHRI